MSPFVGRLGTSLAKGLAVLGFGLVGCWSHGGGGEDNGRELSVNSLALFLPEAVKPMVPWAAGIWWGQWHLLRAAGRGERSGQWCAARGSA